jgi:hypothetical protein
VETSESEDYHIITDNTTHLKHSQVSQVNNKLQQRFSSRKFITLKLMEPLDTENIVDSDDELQVNNYNTIAPSQSRF